MANPAARRNSRCDRAARRRVLCLTLGALAELEARLGAGDLVGLERAVRRRAGFGARPDGDPRGGAARRRQCDHRRRPGADGDRGRAEGRGGDRGAAAARDVRGRGMTAFPWARGDAVRVRRAAAVVARVLGADAARTGGGVRGAERADDAAAGADGARRDDGGVSGQEAIAWLMGSTDFRARAERCVARADADRRPGRRRRAVADAGACAARCSTANR